MVANGAPLPSLLPTYIVEAIHSHKARPSSPELGCWKKPEVNRMKKLGQSNYAVYVSSHASSETWGGLVSLVENKKS